MIPQLVRRGFGYGSGIISPDHSRFILNIPKNASSYMLDWSRHYGWRAALADNVNPKEVIIILRDPVSRWISGIAQYLNGFILSVYGPNGPIYPDEIMTKYDQPMPVDQFIAEYNQVVERLLFDVIDGFDDHVWPQHEMFENILPNAQRKFFYLDSDLNNQLASYLGFEPMSGLDVNAGSSNPNNQKLQQFFTERLKLRPELKARLTKYYQRDYEIITENFGSK